MSVYDFLYEGTRLAQSHPGLPNLAQASMSAWAGAMKAWPLMAEEPPSALPCGSRMTRPFRPGCGTDWYAQSASDPTRTSGQKLWNEETEDKVLLTQSGKESGHIDPGISREVLAGLNHQHLNIWVFRQAIGNDKAGCAATNDDVVRRRRHGDEQLAQ